MHTICKVFAKTLLKPNSSHEKFIFVTFTTIVHMAISNDFFFSILHWICEQSDNHLGKVRNHSLTFRRIRTSSEKFHFSFSLKRAYIFEQFGQLSSSA